MRSHFRSPRAGPRETRLSRIFRARKIAWKPQIALKDGLTRTIAYFDGLLSKPGPRDRLVKEPSAERICVHGSSAPDARKLAAESSCRFHARDKILLLCASCFTRARMDFGGT